MGKLFITVHLVIFCTIAHYAMSDALSKNLFVRPDRTATPVVFHKQGFVIYDSKVAAGEAILKIYGGVE